MGDYIDMALTPQEKAEELGSVTISDGPTPIYPWGLSIRFTHEEIEKLGFEEMAGVGDLVELNCIAKVTSVTQTDTSEGAKCCIEMQIIAIASDDEDEEEEAAPRKKVGPANFYK